MFLNYGSIKVVDLYALRFPGITGFSQYYVIPKFFVILLQ